MIRITIHFTSSKRVGSSFQSFKNTKNSKEVDTRCLRMLGLQLRKRRLEKWTTLMLTSLNRAQGSRTSVLGYGRPVPHLMIRSHCIHQTTMSWLEIFPHNLKLINLENRCYIIYDMLIPSEHYVVYVFFVMLFNLNS